jgi:hypothetical protein
MFNRDFNKLHTYKLEGSIDIFVGRLFVIFFFKLEGSIEIFVGCLFVIFSFFLGNSGGECLFVIFYILIMLLVYLFDRLSRLMNLKTFLRRSSLIFYL